MRIDLKSTVFAAIAIAAGLVVLLGYFFELPLLTNLRLDFLHWGVILAAVAFFVGIVNLARVHWKKVSTRQVGSLYSIVLLVSMFLTLLVAGFLGPTAEWSLWIFNNVQVPIEASLMAVLAVVLAYAAARLFYRRLTVFTLIFIGTVLLVILSTVTFPFFELPGLGGLRTWITQVWATAGARGILLGVALGTVATGLRILMGADRPYGG